MPRPKSLVPKLCIDKSRNRAFCKVDGKFVVLGPAGSAAAQAAYGRLLTALAGQSVDAAIEAAKCRQSVPREPKSSTSLNEVFQRFAIERLPKYAAAERRCIKSAIKTARELYGLTDAEDFDVLRLRTVREAMIRKGWSRSFINKQVKRLRMVIRWAVGWKLVSQTLADSLKTVESLEAGETDAPESAPRGAVRAEHIEAVRPFLTERYRDIIDLICLTGARSGEIIGLTTGMIERTGDVWRCELAKHKTAHKGKSRVLFFNAKAQLILRKYLKPDPTARLFRTRGDRLSASLKDACIEAGVPEFTPHWLRHTVATKIVDEMGIEAAQRLLGHCGAAMTQHYSKGAESKAVEAVKRLG